MHRQLRHLMTLVALAPLALTGCTTMKAIEATGDEFSKGNILTGIYYGTMGVTIGAIMDVFTLGGSMDAEQSSQMWTGAANQYAATKRENTTAAYTPPAAMPVAAPSAAPAPTSRFTYLAQASQDSPSTPATPSSNTTRPSPEEAVRNHCVKIEHYGSYNNWRVANNCSETVIVTFCYQNPDQDAWADLHKCSKDRYGTAGPIAPGKIEGINPPGNKTGFVYGFKKMACATTREKQFLPSLQNQGNSGICR